MADAGHALDEVLQVFRRILERAEIRRVAHQRHLDDVHQARVALADLDFRQIRRQLRPQAVQLADDFVLLLLRIGTVVELDVYRRDAVHGCALQLLHVVE